MTQEELLKKRNATFRMDQVTSGADCIMLGFTRSLRPCRPPFLSEYIGDLDTDSLLIALRVSSNLQIIGNISESLAV